MIERIAFDTKLMRPACVILQATLGCNPRVAHEFFSEDWLTSLTPDMKVYPVTESQLAQLVDMVAEAKSLRKIMEKKDAIRKGYDQEDIRDQDSAPVGVE